MKFPRTILPASLLIAALLSLMAMLASEGDATQATLFYSKPEYRPFLEEWKKIGQAPGSIALLSFNDPHSIWNESMSIGQMIEWRADPTEWTKDQISDLSQFILLKSQQYNISPVLVLSLIDVESRFRSAALSPKGAMGLMQVMPATAEFLATKDGDLNWRGPDDLNNPKVNIEYGLRYMKKLSARFKSPEHVITAYNIGPSALARKLKNGEVVSLDYYQKVMEAMQGYKASAKNSAPPSRKRQWL
jgi:soluble lytic murein transglycosylase-like protein